ncbi:hypothetical protein A5731_22615 [Mycolicibacterium conceptionense]|uniref:Uncharacterized protein n=1 Tax=Mycolicibacterium conceptionense TaxID=451644 RepID=A0A1A0PL34_9MYCO|nr:hypothetical protein [Mycolicibacterium conceptionense]OBB10730.1 hypothetical protein A5718_07925 [Mycolicibacterium conceptionense]OBE98492.1 hypothetical protein A5731_22615 [Mycolicibacterium conceptionense]OBF15020.1 hypothetical protein A5726_22845 [Mycolicibacterium conceptionense]OBF30647.1 hypothetical protein A5720_29840 [Mycolicibacterium conceptionense]OBH94994.1 hypothetical protein A5716_23540 [Mycolicibacterium conceptionense]
MIDLKKIDAPSWQREGARTAILAKAGFTPPDEHAAIAERLARFTVLGTPVTTRLIDAVVSGEGDIEALRAGSLAEWGGDAHRLNEIVSNGVAEAQGRIVREVATETYQTVQKRFNETATAFAKAAAAIDPETAAEDVIALGDLKKQASWQDAAQYAAELDALLVPLLAAAANAGLPHPAGKDTAAAGSRSPKTKSMVLGLVVDASNVENIRDAWSALDAEGRTGPWGQLLRVNAGIAAKNLDAYEPLREPARLVDKKIDRGDGTFGYVTVDPELEPQAEA